MLAWQYLGFSKTYASQLFVSCFRYAKDVVDMYISAIWLSITVNANVKQQSIPYLLKNFCVR